MIKSLLRLGMLTIFLLMPILVHAQDEASESEELPEIPYFKGSSNFNIPILELEGWENQSTEDDGLFVNESLQARIDVTAVYVTSEDEAIQQALAALVDTDLPEPTFNERKGLPNGTWTQQHFVFDDTSISAFALLRRDRTFVVTVMESNPDYDARILAVRPPILPAEGDGEPKGDFAAGMQEAVDALGLIDAEEPDDIIGPEMNSGGEWLTYTYEDMTVTGFMFNDIVYATEIVGDTEPGAELAEAFNIVFLGFFITPDNANYLYLGLGSVVVIFLALIGSMILRHRNAMKDLALVEQLAEG